LNKKAPQVRRSNNAIISYDVTGVVGVSDFSFFSVLEVDGADSFSACFSVLGGFSSLGLTEDVPDGDL